jgi:hypothetical protein
MNKKEPEMIQVADGYEYSIFIKPSVKDDQHDEYLG